MAATELPRIRVDSRGFGVKMREAIANVERFQRIWFHPAPTAERDRALLLELARHPDVLDAIANLEETP